ncbi:MAG: gas vesicle protein GvpO [bacterium]|nr:gas vesicle protein GvpO [bacterium]
MVKENPKTMEIKEIIEQAKKSLADLTGFTSPAGIGFKPEKEGWTVTVQIVEKKSIPEGMDVLGIYEICLDAKGNLLGYQRKALKKRGDTGVEEAGLGE